MMVLYEREKRLERTTCLGQKVFEVLDDAMKNVEKFEWTIMSFKQIPLANILMARSSLKTGDFEGFNQYLKTHSQKKM